MGIGWIYALSYFIIFKANLRKFQAIKQKLQIFPYIVFCNSNSWRIILKRTLNSYISYVLSVYFLLVFDVLNDVPFSLLQSRNKSHYTDSMSVGSSVGIATEHGLDGPWSNPGGDEIFHPFRPELMSTQPPVKLVTWLSQGSKLRQECAADHSPPSIAAVKEE